MVFPGGGALPGLPRAGPPPEGAMPRKTDPDRELARLRAAPGPRTFAFRCPDGLAAKVFRACKALGVDPSDVLRAVVERHLDDYVRSPGADGGRARAVPLRDGLRVTLEPGSDKARLLLEGLADRLAAGEQAVVVTLPGGLLELARAAGEGVGSDVQNVLAQVLSLHLPAFAERAARARQERAAAAGALRQAEAPSPSQAVQRLVQVGREAR